jgi:mono/diheme cytochrome c family protein
MTTMTRFAWAALALLALNLLLVACSSAAPATPTVVSTATTLPTPEPTVDPVLFERGKQVYQRAGCTACHAVKDVGTQGAVATELTNFGTVALERIASEDYKKNLQGQPPATSAAEYIEQSIVHPDVYTYPTCPTGPCPKGTMPTNFQQVIRDPGDLKALIAYLAALK